MGPPHVMEIGPISHAHTLLLLDVGKRLHSSRGFGKVSSKVHFNLRSGSVSLEVDIFKHLLDSFLTFLPALPYSFLYSLVLFPSPDPL